VGVFWGSFAVREAERNHANMLELLGWVEAGRLRPLISATYPLADAAQPLRALLERRVTGKVVLLTGM
jgi:NADPH2:quinone reductase